MAQTAARRAHLVTGCARALVSLSLALLSSVGCSSHSPRRPPVTTPVSTPPTTVTAGGVPALLATTYDRTIARKTARIRFTDEVTVLAPSARKQDTVTNGTGTVDFANNASDVIRDVAGGGGVEVRIIGNDLYRRTAPPSNAPDSTRWTRVIRASATTNPSGTGSGTTAQPGTTAQSSNSDDTALRLGFLSGAATPVAAVGQEAVDGVQTTHYKLVVNLETAAQRGSISAATVESLRSLLGTAMQPTEAWIDAAGLVRQIRITLTNAASGGTGSTSAAPRTEITRTVTYSDFGIPLNITAPPASQIAPG
ncbi:hypothetical protein [Frankia sp. Cppng1_Ct_nod]|uniref:hypothetical protein n=1 Tax=Frankia sp. Cppng1_Ct_nod TaxID=2897162 RepID=UPI001041A463|nr:hypothetical protein [Frankia sp. Cppng1_Ct_nod]